MKRLPTKDDLRLLRKRCVEMAYEAGGGHLGAALSMAEIISVLYKNILHVNPKKPNDPNRDRFILSKGHGCLAFYVTLANLGFFPKSQLKLHCKTGGILPGHTTLGIPGVEASTGSLGHGLPMSVGMAIGIRLDGRKSRVFAILSDGDCQEGSTWEAIMAAGHHGLDNLTVVVDHNNLCSFEPASKTFQNFQPLGDKFAAFSWVVREVDGHDVEQVYKALAASPFKSGKPSVIIAHTTKGKGVSFMENNPLWHYRVPTEDEYQKALVELS